MVEIGNQTQFKFTIAASWQGHAGTFQVSSTSEESALNEARIRLCKQAGVDGCTCYKGPRPSKAADIDCVVLRQERLHPF